MDSLKKNQECPFVKYLSLKLRFYFEKLNETMTLDSNIIGIKLKSKWMEIILLKADVVL